MYNENHSMTKHNNAVARWLGPILSDQSSSFAGAVRGRTLLLVLIIFVAAISFRAAALYYWRAEVVTVQSGVANNYKLFARLLMAEGLTGFFRSDSAMSNPDLLGHPPGYPMLLALIYSVVGEHDTFVQLVQIVADALAALVIFLIVAELLNTIVAFIAGALSSASPQFAWNSIMLLPDTLAVLPLLVAVYLLVRARRSSNESLLLLAGLSIGLSCLLRPNALLFAPFLFVVLLVSGYLSKMRRPRIAAVMLLIGAVTVIAPFTIRNALVLGRFVPLSLGAGQTLLEGIADYDTQRRFGFAETDVGIAKIEAESFGRPDYADTLFGPDGIERDRHRLRRGVQVIISQPMWFAGVMIQRAASMLRMERVPLISVDASRSTGYPLVLRGLQSIFITAVILPLSVLGILILALARRWWALGILGLIPLYYFSVQSALHTEYRYVLALYYSLFAYSAVTVWSIFKLVRGNVR